MSSCVLPLCLITISFFQKTEVFVIILLLVVTSVYYWQDKLVSIIFGMLRQKHFHFIDTYKDEAFTTIKAVVKQVIVLVCAEKSLNNSIWKHAHFYALKEPIQVFWTSFYWYKFWGSYSSDHEEHCLLEQFSILETVGFSKTWVNFYHTTWRHISEDSILI